MPPFRTRFITPPAWGGRESSLFSVDMLTAGPRPHPPMSTTRRPIAGQLTAMTTPRGALAAAVLGDRIHAVGGVGHDRRNTSAHEAYDPATNRWTALAVVPTPRDHLAVVASEERLFAAGGRIDGSYSRKAAAVEGKSFNGTTPCTVQHASAAKSGSCDVGEHVYLLSARS